MNTNKRLFGDFKTATWAGYSVELGKPLFQKPCPHFVLVLRDWFIYMTYGIVRLIP